MLKHIFTLSLIFPSVFLAAEGSGEPSRSFVLKDMKATVESRQKAFEEKIMRHVGFRPTSKAEMIWECIANIRECSLDVGRSVLETCPGMFDMEEQEWTMTGACSIGLSVVTSPAIIATYGDSLAYFEWRLDLCETRRPGCIGAMFDYLKSEEASGDATPASVKRARMYIFVDQFPKRHPVSASDSDGDEVLGFMLKYCRTDEVECGDMLRQLRDLCETMAGCSEGLHRLVPNYFAEDAAVSMDDITRIVNFIESYVRKDHERIFASLSSTHDEL